MYINIVKDKTFHNYLIFFFTDFQIDVLKWDFASIKEIKNFL